MKKTSFRLLILTVLCMSFVGGLWLTAPPSTEARGAAWNVQVFNNVNLSGSPIWVGISPTVSYTWGAGAPVINGAPTGAPADNFSIRFTTSAFFTAGNYRFTVQVAGGARLCVETTQCGAGGLLLINQWTPGTFRTFQADFNFATDGNHNITVEMFDSGGDSAIIANWALAVGSIPTPTITCTGTPWYAEFFNGIDLAGTAIFTTTYPPSGLNQSWPSGSPGGPVPASNWSARFTRTLNVPTDLPAGVYTFYASADDNYRFIVDVTTIIDSWGTFGGNPQSAPVTLMPGPHTLKMEFRQLTVGASVFLTWTPPSAQCPVIPPTGGGSTGGGTGGGTGQPTGVTGTVNVPQLHFRSAPSTTASILATLNQGTTYPVTGRSADNAWAQILVNGQTGWVMAKFLTFAGDFNTVPVVGAPAPSAPAAPPPSNAQGLSQANLRIHTLPSAFSPTVGVLPFGTKLPILGKDEGRSWYQINFSGTVGWVYSPFVKLIQGDYEGIPYTDGTQPPFEPAPPTTGVIVEAFGNMRIRSGPGFQFPKIARAVYGTRLQVLGRSTSLLWYKVKYGDTVGWTLASWYRLVQGDLSTVPVGDQ